MLLADGQVGDTTGPIGMFTSFSIIAGLLIDKYRMYRAARRNDDREDKKEEAAIDQVTYKTVIQDFKDYIKFHQDHCDSETTRIRAEMDALRMRMDEMVRDASNKDVKSQVRIRELEIELTNFKERTGNVSGHSGSSGLGASGT